jgi:hypothetical protein
MSVPLDRLYYYIESVAKDLCHDNIIIYRFSPHGSKKPEDLLPFRKYIWTDEALCPQIYCNDQEPLNWDLYVDTPSPMQNEMQILSKDNGIIFDDLNFRVDLRDIWISALLLHSERRSTNLERYSQSQFIPVYYWSHAVIALDWFRFARYVQPKKTPGQLFLIYNRAWSGTREYRLKFADYLIQLDLTNNCLMRVSPVDSTVDKHYDLYTFENPQWRPANVVENFFPECTADSHYSADFDFEDYKFTDIEVVLETLFDDARLHLTEKTLRPIAIGQPFILAGTHGSLKYLQSYGFKTFGDIWDEQYDQIVDPEERLMCIADLMKQIANWAPEVRDQKLTEAQAIADYNKKHFFSQKFEQQVLGELQANLTDAFDLLEATNTSSQFFKWRRSLGKNPKLSHIATAGNNDRTRAELARIVHHARKYYLRTLSTAQQ